MQSRERALVSLNHSEPDRVPFDLGGMAQSGIHSIAYGNLRSHLGLPPCRTAVLNVITQAARIDTDVKARLKIDTDLVYGHWADVTSISPQEDGEYLAYVDEWGVGRRMQKSGGYYYDICSHPLGGEDGEKKLDAYRWPDPLRPSRFEGLREEAQRARDSGRLTVLMGLCPGIVEMYSWLRGFERFYLDLALEPRTVEFFLHKLFDLKIAYWKHALALIGPYIDVINEADDMAAQDSMAFSPETYRVLIKPHHRRLFSEIKKACPGVKILFHSCGAVRPIIPDLIEIGVDILNPIQISARGMEPAGLKRDFGRDLCFWGGGVDTQKILVNGTEEQIRDHVKKNRFIPHFRGMPHGF